MEAFIIRTSDEFGKLNDPWNRLLERSCSWNIFLTFEWLSTWWKFFGAHYKLQVVLVYDEGELIGAAPLMISREYGFRRLKFMSTGIADYEDFIIAGAENVRSKVVGLIFSVLLKDKEWDIFRLQGIREDSPNFPYFQSFDNTVSNLKNGHFELIRHQDGAFYVDTSGKVEEYLGTLRKRFLSDTRRLKARLFRLGNVHFCDRALELESISEVLGKHMSLQMTRRKSMGTKSMFSDPSVRSFFHDITGSFAKNGWLDLSCIEVNDTLAAVHLGYKYREHFFSYTLGLNDQYLGCGIGRLMFFHLIERCFQDSSRTFDFMLGGERYKSFFNPKIKNLHFMIVCPRTVRGASAYLLFQGGNLLYKKMRGKKW